jgi:type III restriction enzyme
VSGFHRTQDDDTTQLKQGRLPLFRNFDEVTGLSLARPYTLLIDSEQLEAGDALDKGFGDMAADEIERFRRELIERTGDPHAADQLTDQDLLREVMNTVGKTGRLGAQIRCMVSVSMLTEGWDANNVTHILGIRAFGTQLLCEQVIGRALRRQSYDLNEERQFNAEYADIFGVPFDFTAKPAVAPPQPPRETVTVKALRPERDPSEIRFPRVEGYRVELPEERLTATFDEDSVLVLTPNLVGPPRTRTPPSSARLDTCLVCRGDTYPALLLYQELADMACNRIHDGITQALEGRGAVKALLDPYNPTGSTAHVRFTTSKTPRWDTLGPPPKNHVSWVICDSDWESEFCRVAEAHPRVVAYTKNHGLGFEVPYRHGAEIRRYLPDFILRVDDGRGPDDLLHLVVEIKGYRGEDAKDKKATMDTYWVPGVNNLKTYGRWAFAEFTELYAMEADFAARMAAELNKMIEGCSSR